MKKRWYILVGLASALAMGAYGATASFASVTNPEPQQPRPQPQRCCPIGISYLSGPGRVVLEQMCNRGQTTTFHFRTVGLPSTCTHPPGTLLRDGQGRRYSMLGFHGIPDCRASSMNAEGNIRFSWSFQRLQPGVQKIDLIEVEDEITAGLTFWAWRNVDLSHCGL